MGRHADRQLYRQANRHSDRPKYSPSPLGGAGKQIIYIKEANTE